MAEVPRLTEAFEGYVVLAEELLAGWTPVATDVATKIGSGSYDPDDLAADFSRVAKLLADAWMAIGSEAVDAISILTSSFSEQTSVDGYGTDPQKAGGERTLTIEADLVSKSGKVLPASQVIPVPTTLPPHHTRFRLDVNGAGMKARTYDGHVVATDEDGNADAIFVSVTIG